MTSSTSATSPKFANIVSDVERLLNNPSNPFMSVSEIARISWKPEKETKPLLDYWVKIGAIISSGSDRYKRSPAFEKFVVSLKEETSPSYKSVLYNTKVFFSKDNNYTDDQWNALAEYVSEMSPDDEKNHYVNPGKYAKKNNMSLAAVIAMMTQYPYLTRGDLKDNKTVLFFKINEKMRDDYDEYVHNIKPSDDHYVDPKNILDEIGHGSTMKNSLVSVVQLMSHDPRFRVVTSNGDLTGYKQFLRVEDNYKLSEEDFEDSNEHHVLDSQDNEDTASIDSIPSPNSVVLQQPVESAAIVHTVYDPTTGESQSNLCVQTPFGVTNVPLVPSLPIPQVTRSDSLGLTGYSSSRSWADQVEDDEEQFPSLPSSLETKQPVKKPYDYPDYVKKDTYASVSTPSTVTENSTSSSSIVTSDNVPITQSTVSAHVNSSSAELNSVLEKFSSFVDVFNSKALNHPVSSVYTDEISGLDAKKGEKLRKEVLLLNTQLRAMRDLLTETIGTAQNILSQLDN